MESVGCGCLVFYVFAVSEPFRFLLWLPGGSWERWVIVFRNARIQKAPVCKCSYKNFGRRMGLFMWLFKTERSLKRKGAEIC